MNAPRPNAQLDDVEVSHRAARNLSAMGVGRIVTQVVMIASALLIPRVLGIDAFGEYATVMALVVTLEVVGSGGLHLAETRFVAPLWQTDRGDARVVASSIWTSRLVYSCGAGTVALLWLLVGSTALATAGGAGLLVVSRSALEASRQLFLSLDRVRLLVGYEVARALLVLAVVTLGHASLGLSGVLFVLAVGHGVLFALATAQVRSIMGLDVSLRSDELRSILRFGAATMVGLISWIAQAQVPVYILGSAAEPADAAVFAVAVQIYALGQALLIAPWQAMMPIFSELHSEGRREELEHWGAAIVSWGVAGGVAAALGWAMTGDGLLRVLPAEFAAVHAPGTLVLVALTFLATTAGTNAMLFAAGAPRTASANQVVFAAVTIAVTLIVVLGDLEPFGVWLGAGYALSALVFAIAAQRTLRTAKQITVPVRRAVILALPLLLLPVAHRLEFAWELRSLLAVAAVVAYATVALRTGLLSLAVFRRSEPSPA